jgi:hypothetical protein
MSSMLNDAIKKNGTNKETCVEYCLNNSLDEVVTNGRVQFLNDYVEYYFEDRPNVYSREFINPTYLDLAVFVNDQISHIDSHVFLEKCMFVEEKDGVKIYSYELGS